jgi:glycosyltransferase EpsE
LKVGSRSMVNKIETIVIKHAREAYVSQEYLNQNWEAWGFFSCPDYATALMRKDVITKIGGYNIACDKYRIEDYDMWCRLIEANYEIMNTTEFLYKCRWDPKNYYKRRKLAHLLGYAKYKFHWSKRLGFGIDGYIHAFLVLIKAFVPTQIKKRYHRMKLNKND